MALLRGIPDFGYEVSLNLKGRDDFLPPTMLLSLNRPTTARQRQRQDGESRDRNHLALFRSEKSDSKLSYM